MSRKVFSVAKFTILLTIFGCVIPTVYKKLFHESFLFCYGLPSPNKYSILTSICGLICIIGIVVGLTGIFKKKAKTVDRFICIVCTLLCLAFLEYVLTLVGASRERFRRVVCASNLNQIGLALKQYAEDYDDFYPPENGAAGLEVLRKKGYLKINCIYTCPMRGQEKKPLTEDNVDYVYVGGLKSTSDPNLPLAYDKANNHEFYGNVLYANGIVKGFTGNPWTEKIKQ
ncbi:MAG: DUF1559 domain-containing protein [Victivallaceae bacterium]